MKKLRIQLNKKLKKPKKNNYKFQYQRINMEINVHLINDDKHQKLTLPKQSRAVDTLKKLKIPPDTVIITRNNQPIPIDSELEPGDKLKIIRVISGG